MDTQAVKHAIQHSGRYNRRGFESPTQRAKALGESYQSELIASIRENNFTFQKTFQAEDQSQIIDILARLIKFEK